MRIVIACLLLTGCASVPQKIVLSPTAENNLLFLHGNLRVEFAFCAYGDTTNDLIRVRRIDLPTIYEASPVNVRYEVCKGKDLLGFGHSHVNSVCEFSEVDFHTMLTSDPPYGFLICKNKRFVWYSKREAKKASKP